MVFRALYVVLYYSNLDYFCFLACSKTSLAHCTLYKHASGKGAAGVCAEIYSDAQPWAPQHKGLPRSTGTPAVLALRQKPLTSQTP